MFLEEVEIAFVEFGAARVKVSPNLFHLVIPGIQIAVQSRRLLVDCFKLGLRPLGVTRKPGGQRDDSILGAPSCREGRQVKIGQHLQDK